MPDTEHSMFSSKWVEMTTLHMVSALILKVEEELPAQTGSIKEEPQWMFLD